MEKFIPTKEQIKAGLDLSQLTRNTEELITTSTQASKLAQELMENNTLNVEKFNEYYKNGASSDNISFGYQFAGACVDKVLQQPKSDIKEKLPMVIQTFAHMNDSAFAFALDYLKIKLESYHPEYKE